MAKTLNITLVKSAIAYPKNQKLTLKALGLTKLNKTVTKPDNEQIRGMIKTVAHLVSVEEA